ncbi:MAG: methionine aminotransferase [Pseudomonadales bacterium]
MSALANKHGAINLSQGFPDYNPPSELLEAACSALSEGHNQYAPMAGLIDLRLQVGALTKLRHHYDADPETEITIVPGATEAIFCAIQACVNHGEEVIVFDPAYDCYEPSVTLAGGKTIHLPLQLPNFHIDWQQLADSITPATRMIIINSPHNPTGSVLNQQDLERLADIVRDTRIIILSDEVYEYLVYDGQVHHSVLSHAELRERSYAIFSFGKTLHATGWKTGYCIAPPALSRELRKIHQYVCFVAVTPIQRGLADYLAHHWGQLNLLSGFYQQKRDLFCQGLNQSRFKLIPSAGTYFQLADYGEISDMGDLKFSRWLTTEVGVAAIPLSPFYAEKNNNTLVRFCFAKQDATLQEALIKLCQI